MRKPFLIALAVAVAPLAAQAETINLYGWQNHSWEFLDVNGSNTDRLQSNAGNIGFSASMDTGMNGIKVNLQCEQFTFYNRFTDFAGANTWCNRNSKIGLAHPQMGEFMFATWLLPYNEGVAQWIDPFYDAGADSHTSIMGGVGGSDQAYYNPGFARGTSSSFNRRQNGILQYWSPNWNGFVFRFAWTPGYRDETAAPVGDGEIDPVIRSSSLAYTNGPMWLAVTWQDHEDWTAASVGEMASSDSVGEMASSDAESWRLAGRYIADLGDGMSVQISAMYEDLEYEFNNVTSITAAMSAFGFPNFESTYASVMPDMSEKTFKVNVRESNEGACLQPDVKLDNCRGKTDDTGAEEKLPKDYQVANTEADKAELYRLGSLKYSTVNDNVKVEREAWMVSGKIKFGGPIDFRFSYMDADDLEVSCSVCGGDWQDTAADAWNVGLFYTMPAGTELRLTYSEVDNDENGTYGQGVSGTGLGTAGVKIEMFALGIVHWFD